MLSYLQLADRTQARKLRLSPEAADELGRLLKKYGTDVSLTAVHQDGFKLEIQAHDKDSRKTTPLLAWVLTLCAVLMQTRAKLVGANGWEERAFF